MEAEGVSRLVVVSAASVGTIPAPRRSTPPRHDAGDGLVMRHLLSPLIKIRYGRLYLDLALMEEFLREGKLEWTVVRPPRLVDQPLTSTYRLARGRNARRGLSVSRANVAHLMLGVLAQPDTIGQVISVAR
jgi:hypothetical protein